MNQENQGYTLFVKALLQKDLEKIDISNFSETQKQEIESVANTFFDRGMIIESLKTFYLLKNTEKLNQLGSFLLENKRNELAYEAFKFAKNQEGLNLVGEAFLENSEIEKAHAIFKLTNNLKMIEFIESNFERKFNS